jgi:hypothetical protein
MNDKDIINDEFKAQLKSLEKIYEQSTLKEKHKLNEHIKFILQSHVNKNTEAIEKDLK